MDLPGIEVRPLKTVLGSSEFAEVFLTDVRVPVANRVGDENDGWRVTNVTLKYERGTAFVSELVDSIRLAEDLARYQVTTNMDIGIEHELGRCIAEFDALWALTKRNVSQSTRGTTGPGAMVMKLAYSEARATLRRAVPQGPGPRRVAHRRQRARRGTAAHARADDCGGCVADPAQHHRRACARPASGAAVMDLELSDDQVALRDGIASMLDRAHPDRARPPRLRPGDVRRARERGCVLPAHRWILVGGLCRGVRAARPVLRSGSAGAVAPARRRPHRRPVSGRAARRRPDLGRASRCARRAVRRRHAAACKKSTRSSSKPSDRRGRSTRARPSPASTASPKARPSTSTGGTGTPRARPSPLRSNSVSPTG